MNTTAQRQSKGFYVLLFAEMCERYSFYTFVYLLVLYLTNERGMTDTEAGLLYGTVMSFVYLAVVAGGFVADRVLGLRRSIQLGAVISAAGCALLSGGIAPNLALAALITGTGLFRGNVISLLGCLFRLDTRQQEAAFSIYYMGINAGSFAASLGSGYIANAFGYSWAFAAAGIGQLLAFAIFVLGRRSLQGQGMAPARRLLARPDGTGMLLPVLVVVSVLAITGVISLLLPRADLAQGVLFSLSLLAVGYFMLEMRREHRAVRRRLSGLLVLFVFAVIFWAVYGQTDLSVILYIERRVDHAILGELVPTTAFEGLNPIFVLLLAPVFAWLWLRLAMKNADPSVPLKFVFGLISLALAFFVLKLGDTMTPANSLVPPFWLVAFFLLFTVGELCVSPIGMSLVSRLAPARLLGFTMGLWFLTEAIAKYLSGLINDFAAVPADATAAAAMIVFADAFGDYGWMALAGALALTPLVGLLRRLISNQGPEGDNGRMMK
ncbi:MAG: peptide MFS transporter [Thiohalocapsa sp.]